MRQEQYVISEIEINEQIPAMKVRQKHQYKRGNTFFVSGIREKETQMFHLLFNFKKIMFCTKCHL